MRQVFSVYAYAIIADLHQNIIFYLPAAQRHPAALWVVPDGVEGQVGEGAVELLADTPDSQAWWTVDHDLMLAFGEILSLTGYRLRLLVLT